MKLPDEVLAEAVKICLDLRVDGHRGDLTLVKATLTLAAWRHKDRPGLEEILAAAELALPHRMRGKPFQEVDFDLRSRLSEARSD